MILKLYPKAQLEALWDADKAYFSSEAASPPACLRCGNPLHRQLIRNPLSRYADVHICGSCGRDEAMRDVIKDPLPLTKWHAAKEDLRTTCIGAYAVSLQTECTFNHVFEQTKSIPLTSVKHPVSEVVYSRSYYDDRKWWTTWFDCQEEKPSWELTQEIDGFTAGLFSMPEMETLDAMRQFCNHTEATSCNTEYNLYAETDHFYIWLRLITRSKDYNLYVHYYLKEA